MFACLPPYNSNFRYFEIKSLVPRTLNLPDSIVFLSTDVLNRKKNSCEAKYQENESHPW